jgi:hypothetical protein
MAIMGSLDIAQIALYATRLFFAELAFYLQRENMREGYPLVTDGGKRSANQGLFPAPEPKVFDLPHGQGSRTVLDNKPERKLALRQTEIWNGAPFEPTGDPMVDGVEVKLGDGIHTLKSERTQAALRAIWLCAWAEAHTDRQSYRSWTLSRR